ncbi:hypothetical protein [Nitrosomonas ureae]|uniref:Uncharacterized protein n=1 Tax=Nitrosomonas ureae TaxID=44577 RepID=A0A286AFL4_9PROT|nr:hypothetical protein [Nitrosomonas ureae]SOD20698.1 hypothetical protein SAMN06297164_2749 [Nitrosomonas ureae]
MGLTLLKRVFAEMRIAEIKGHNLTKKYSALKIILQYDWRGLMQDFTLATAVINHKS